MSRGDHRRRSSSAPWSSSPTSCPWCRFWTFLGRRGEIRWWRCAGTWCPRPPFSSRRSRRPNVPLSTQTAEQSVEVPTEPGYAPAVIAVKALGGGQQRHWRTRSLTFQFLSFGGEGGGGLQGFRPGQGSTASLSSRFLDDADEGILVFFFFRTFSPAQKKCGGNPPVESESARQCQLVRAGLSSNGSCRGV